MKRRTVSLIISLLAFFAVRFGVVAQDVAVVEVSDSTYNIVTHLADEEGVTIVQPASLTARLSRSRIEEVTSADGAASKPQHGDRVSQGAVWRVEVFSDNTRQAKTNATSRRRTVQSRFPQWPTVLVFESPFWRVKTGAFSSRGDAEAAMAEIKAAFPAYSPYLRVVRN